MTVYYDLCHATAELALCRTCRRNTAHEFNSAAAGEPYQRFTYPTTEGSRCPSWSPIPSPLNSPRVDTGD